MKLVITRTVSLLLLATLSSVALADPIVFEGFDGYPEDALISDNPAGPAPGLAGDWTLAPDNFFYVNRTELDLEAGVDKAVYDMPYDDNGARTAQRQTAREYALLDADGDVFYAGFRVNPPRADGAMLFSLILEQLVGGGQPALSFGMNDGSFVVGNGGVNTDVQGGTATAEEMQLVLRVEYGGGGSGPDGLEVVTLWVDPVDEGSSAVIDQVAVDLLNGGGVVLTAVAIRGEQMDGQPALFDDLAVGFEFADVITAPPDGSLSNDLGVNGLFYDPNNSGHGFDFVAHTLGLTVYYYGHTAGGERLWLVSEDYGADLGFDQPFTLEMFEVATGVFGQPESPATAWGTVTIELADCDSGHASFSGLDGSMEMDFVRLTALPGTTCH